MKHYLLFLLTLFISLGVWGQKRKYELPAHVNKSDYNPHVIVVKLKPAPGKASRGGTSLKSVPALNAIKTRNIERALPYLNSTNTLSRNAEQRHPLSDIYKITLDDDEDVMDAINKLLTHDEVIYAEPYFDHRPLYIPSDPEAALASGKQTYLDVIHAYDAWTIEQGDTSVVIAILDTGTDPTHEDLIDNISYNYDDPINGVDDDADGLIDNYWGWDMANYDNIPQADTDPHGIAVSGTAAASTNNGIGIAGAGFKSKFLPIKVFQSGFNSFNNGYEAIALAADLGCKVINLSWGSVETYTQFGQDIINYAVLDKDVAVVAAAGNTNGLLNFYPASYDNVISVGATKVTDEKTSWATYSYNIDLMAPGEGIYSTTKNNSYTYDQGTSFASPLVAGTIALIRARFPNLTAKQAMERVRVTADDIYSVPANAPYQGQLGKGRLNMLKALTDNSSPSIRIENMTYNNGVGSYAFYGDTVTISMDFMNYLSKSSSATATLSSLSPYVTLVDSVFSIGSLATLASKSNTSAPFRVLLHNDLPPDEQMIFRVDFEDGAYTDFQHFIITSSPDYATVDNSSLAITIASNGNLGYSKDPRAKGVGVTYEDNKILENIGLITATSSTTVADNAPTYPAVFERGRDFDKLQNVKFYTNSVADLDLRDTFYDSSSLLNVDIEQKTLAWTDAADKDFIILEYRLTNTGSATLSGIHTALAADWNLNDKDFNKAGWDAANLLGYIKDAETDSLYTGLALLTSQAPIYYAIDNKNFNGNSADISPTIDDAKKYQLVSQGVAQMTAGDANNGNDVSHVLGGTIDSLAVGGSQKVAFAMVAGHSLADLQAAVAAAHTKYQQYLNNPPLLYTTYTCPGTSTTIDPPQGDMYEFYSDVALTNLLTTGTSYPTPTVTSAQTYYVINKDGAYDSDVSRVIAAPKPVNTDFSINPSPLLLDENGKTLVSFEDLSKDAVAWSWDFGNGFTGTAENPIMNYTHTGSYTVSLTATNDLGCVEMTSKSLEVANRSNLPNTPDQNICKGESVTLSADNATQLEFYSDEGLINLLHSGTSFTSGPIMQDSTFYVISVDSVYASNAKAVNITVSDVLADFSYEPDTTDITQKYLLHFTSKSQNEALYYWYFNDQLSLVNSDVDYNYNGLSFTAKLIAEDSNGCFDTLTQVITPAVSTIPQAQEINICKGDAARIAPSNGTVFYFYADPALTDLKHKGSSALLTAVTQDTTVYITGMDSLQESGAISVTVNVSDLQAKFSKSWIPESSATIITNESVAAQHYLWLLNGDSLTTDKDPVFNVNSGGEYIVELQVEDSIGCTDSFSDTVLLIVSGVSEKIRAEKLYPNPTSGWIYLPDKALTAVDVLSMDGKIVAGNVPVRNNYIDISHLPDGHYLLRMTSKKTISFSHIIKRPD